MIYKNNFNLLNEILENKLIELSSCETGGNVNLRSGSYMNLTIKFLMPNLISMINYFVLNGVLVPDPDIEIRIDPEFSMIEVLGYKDSFCYQRVYKDDDRRIVDIKLKRDLNQFLHKWLNNLKKRGFTYSNHVME